MFKNKSPDNKYYNILGVSRDATNEEFPERKDLEDTKKDIEKI